MATYTDDGPQYFKPAAEIDDQGSDLEENKKDVGNQFIRCVPAGMPCMARIQRCREAVQKVRPPSAHISRQRKEHVGVSCDLLLLLSQRYCVIMVLIRGIDP